VEPATAIVTVGKLIGLGITGWKALDHHGFGKEDLEALQAFLESGASTMRKPECPPPAALQLAMIARAFGRAVGRHQMFHGMVPIKGPVSRWLDREERKREREIELRVKGAMLQVQELGNDPAGEIASIDALTGDPIGTPYYRALWQAFSDPALTIGEVDESPPLVMSNTARREFERYFLLAYLDSLVASGGAIEPYLDGLTRYRTVLVRDLLTRDLAAWGGRHVFGNKTREQWSENEAIPFLPLEAMYVEPDGALIANNKAGPPEPLLAIIEQLTAENAEPRVVIVTADFGSGKSLSAREFARRWAEKRLTSPMVSLDVPLPIHVRCADDFPSETVDIELTVRRAWKRQAEGAEYSAADDDESFAWPSSQQRTVCLLDGLDEVVLGEQHLRTLFEKLRGKTTRRHRFVVFSRPGALPQLDANVEVVHVQSFGADQIEQWLARWNTLHADDAPITLDELTKRNLATIARTPILLFMVAFTWRQQTIGAGSSIAEIYEHFFYQVAHGKAHGDPDLHGPIAAASEKLLDELRTAGILVDSSGREDAMLWLMGRVAWEAYILEQEQPSGALTRWHVDSLLREGEVSITSDVVIGVIRNGLILTLQADLHSTNHTILFGHKSFREFLVGRHWAMTLRRLVRGEHSESEVVSSLLGGRLLSHEDKSFGYVMEFINTDRAASERAASPLGWSNDERDRLARWAQRTFDDEGQDFRPQPRRPRDTSFRNDRRAKLREAALAVGSMIKDGPSMRAKDPLALRSMLAWFWVCGAEAILVARNAKLVGAHLELTHIRAACLVGADLSKAEFGGAYLDEADLSKATLIQADLRATQLVRANLSEADLRGAYLQNAVLECANLLQAQLSAVVNHLPGRNGGRVRRV
jgi:hypothetical protein